MVRTEPAWTDWKTWWAERRDRLVVQWCINVLHRQRVSFFLCFLFDWLKIIWQHYRWWWSPRLVDCVRLWHRLGRMRNCPSNKPSLSLTRLSQETEQSSVFLFFLRSCRAYTISLYFVSRMIRNLCIVLSITWPIVCLLVQVPSVIFMTWADPR